MDAIVEHGLSNVTSEMRTELASRIRDNAGNTFFTAWARDPEAMVLIVNWLKAGVTGKDNGIWEGTIMPLLHVSRYVAFNLVSTDERRELYRCLIDCH